METKRKTIKVWNFFFKFPTAKAAHAEQLVTVKGASNLGLATNRAWSVLKKRQGIKGARLEEGSISWTVYTEKE